MIRGLFRMTPGQFKRAARAGFYQDRKVELLGGIVFEMTPNPPHVAVVRNLYEALRLIVIPRGYYPIKEDPISLGRWLPLPDVAVLRGSDQDYLRRLPTAPDIVLIVEVSDTTLWFDRARKRPAYARAGVREYWIVNLPERQLEVYRDPSGSRYRQETLYGEAEVVAPLAAPGAIVRVSDLLPPRPVGENG